LDGPVSSLTASSSREAWHRVRTDRTAESGWQRPEQRTRPRPAAAATSWPSVLRWPAPRAGRAVCRRCGARPLRPGRWHVRAVRRTAGRPSGTPGWQRAAEGRAWASALRRRRHRAFQFRQVLIDGGLQDRVSSVEVAMSEVVTHPGDLGPRDCGLGAE